MPCPGNRSIGLVKKIPRGRVTTYGELAKALRLPGGARAAGYAMAACPSGRGIPWHRVVGAGGRLLIPEPHASLQRRLLETEGIVDRRPHDRHETLRMVLPKARTKRRAQPRQAARQSSARRRR